jgi:hypothetical protein
VDCGLWIEIMEDGNREGIWDLLRDGLWRWIAFLEIHCQIRNVGTLKHGPGAVNYDI